MGDRIDFAGQHCGSCGAPASKSLKCGYCGVAVDRSTESFLSEWVEFRVGAITVNELRKRYDFLPLENCQNRLLAIKQ